jgi:hypothetical protein
VVVEHFFNVIMPRNTGMIIWTRKIPFFISHQIPNTILQNFTQVSRNRDRHRSDELNFEWKIGLSLRMVGHFTSLKEPQM